MPANRIAHQFTVYVVTDGDRIRNITTILADAEARCEYANEKDAGGWYVLERMAHLIPQEQRQSVVAQR